MRAHVPASPARPLGVGGVGPASARTKPSPKRKRDDDTPPPFPHRRGASGHKLPHGNAVVGTRGIFDAPAALPPAASAALGAGGGVSNGSGCFGMRSGWHQQQLQQQQQLLSLPGGSEPRQPYGSYGSASTGSSVSTLSSRSTSNTPAASPLSCSSMQRALPTVGAESAFESPSIATSLTSSFNDEAVVDEPSIAHSDLPSFQLGDSAFSAASSPDKMTEPKSRSCSVTPRPGSRAHSVEPGQGLVHAGGLDFSGIEPSSSPPTFASVGKCPGSAPAGALKLGLGLDIARSRPNSPSRRELDRFRRGSATSSPLSMGSPQLNLPSTPPQSPTPPCFADAAPAAQGTPCAIGRLVSTPIVRSTPTLPVTPLPTPGGMSSPGGFATKSTLSLTACSSPPLSSQFPAPRAPQRRPMPNPEAFDTSRRQSYSKKPVTPLSSPVCPPTPVRTPVWAHQQQSGARASGRERGRELTRRRAGSAGDAASGGNTAHGVFVAGAGVVKGGSASVTGGGAFVDAVADDNAMALGPFPPTPARGFSMLERQNSLCGTKTLLTIGGVAEVDGELSFSSAFEHLGRIGGGSFSDVFRVLCRADGIQYAVKKAKRQFRSKRDRERQMQEIRISEMLSKSSQSTSAASSASALASASTASCVSTSASASDSICSCPNIVRYVRAWQEEGYLFTQLELCERGTLQRLAEALDMEGTQLPEATIWCVVADCSTGLAHLHQRGLVHLDIKPPNIFISRDGVFKLGDFGMSSEMGQLEDGQEGDNRYMAKELLRGRVASCWSADIFSLGIMLFEVAADVECLPQEGEFWQELREGKVPPLSDGRSQKLDSAIRLMMDPRPDNRPRAETILEDAAVRRALDPAQRDTFIASLPLPEELTNRNRVEPGTASARSKTRRLNGLSIEPGTASGDSHADMHTPTEVVRHLNWQ